MVAENLKELLRDTGRPAWIDCPDCGDMFCTIHEDHTHDCICPDVLTWDEAGLDPYSTGGPTVDNHGQEATRP